MEPKGTNISRLVGRKLTSFTDVDSAPSTTNYNSRHLHTGVSGHSWNNTDMFSSLSFVDSYINRLLATASTAWPYISYPE